MELTQEQIRLLISVTLAYRTEWFTSEQVYQLNELRQMLQDAETITIN